MKYINADELTEELEKFREIKDSEYCQGINAMLDTALMIIHNFTLGDEKAEIEKTMTNKEAIDMLRSKMDGKTDTSYEWCECVRMAIKALSEQESDIGKGGKQSG